MLKVKPEPVAVDTTKLFAELVDINGSSVAPPPDIITSVVEIVPPTTNELLALEDIVVDPAGVLKVKPEPVAVDTTRLFKEFVERYGSEVLPLPDIVTSLTSIAVDPLNRPFNEFALAGFKIVLSAIVCLSDENLNNQKVFWWSFF